MTLENGDGVDGVAEVPEAECSVLGRRHDVPLDGMSGGVSQLLIMPCCCFLAEC